MRVGPLMCEMAGHAPAGDALKFTSHSTITLLRLHITIYTPSQSPMPQGGIWEGYIKGYKVVTFIKPNYNRRPSALYERQGLTA